MSEERVPCHAFINVIEQETIYKNDKWWCAVVRGEKAGKPFVGLYLWQHKQDQDIWRMKNKWNFNNQSTFRKIIAVAERLVKKL